MFGWKIQAQSCPTEQGTEKLKQALADCDAVVIGAGAGLSTSAGFVYQGPRFDRYFSDFARKYGFHDMYSGSFYPYSTPEEQWAFWSRCIFINRYLAPPKPVYDRLYQLVQDKDYFVLTTNVDHCFQRSGFAKERLFYTQGDYGLFQCSKPCCRETWDNEEQVRAMLTAQGYVPTEQDLTLPEGTWPSMAIPSDLVPRCPVCGRPVAMNLRGDDKFVEDAGWHAAARRYTEFLQTHQDADVLFLELGTGMNTPTIIKFAFWDFTRQWRDATYACVNLNEAYAPEDIRGRSICIGEDIGKVLEELLQ